MSHQQEVASHFTPITLVLLLVLGAIAVLGCGSTSPSTPSASPVTVLYSEHGVSFSYQTPTLKTVDIADIPASLTLESAAFMQPGAADRLSSVAIVPTAKDPDALVVVMVLSEPPAIIEQLQGMTKSQFMKVLPNLADSMDQGMSERVGASTWPKGMVVSDCTTTHGLANGTPSILMRVSGEQDGTEFAVQTQFLFSRRNLYAVMLGNQRVGAQSDSQSAALSDAFRSITVKW